MRLLSRLGFAVAAIATISIPARSEPYSPFLDDLRAKVQFLLDHAGTLDERDPEVIALQRALAALDRPSESVVDDLENLSRAVRTLEPERPGRTWVHTGTWESVHTAIYLFYYRLESRREELRRLFFDSLSGFTRERSLALRALSAAYAPLEMDPFRRGSQRSATRRLLRAARLLERASVNLGAGSDTPFVEGSVTAVVGGQSRTWKIASAAVHEQAGPGGPAGIPPNGLHVYAVSEDPHSLVQMRPLYFSAPGEAMSGLIDFVAFPNESLLFPTAIRLQPNSDLPSEITLDSLDLAAGTAHVTFSLNMIAPEFPAYLLVTGEITITGGLQRR